jgi:LDH2 family malate/lactate/ureidoglycolate dehydrogenase
MTSLLAGAAILAPMLGPDGKRGHGQNATIILIDIARLREPDDYRSDVSALSSIIRSLPRAEGADALRLPGERAASEAHARRNAGVPIPQKLWDEITALANKHDVCIPDLE